MSTSSSTPIRQLGVLMATAFVDMMGFAIVLPLLPFYAKHLGARPFQVGLLMSAFFLAQLLTAPFWGRLSDRYGRRPMILAGLLMSALAFVFFGFAVSLWHLLLSRLVQGVGSGTTGVVQAYVTDSSDPEDRAKILGWVTAATSAGVMLGSSISSFAFYLGRSAPGYVAALLCVLNFIFAWFWLPEPKRHAPSGGPRPSLRRSIFDVLRHPGTPVASLIWIYAVGMMAFMGMNSMLALYLGQVFGITEKTIGFFITYVGGVGLVMRALLLGPAVRRFGEVGVMRLGAASLALGLAVVPIPGLLSAPNPVRLTIFALIALFVPVGTAFLFPSSTALVSRRAPQSQVGQIMGVQQAFGGVSRLVGPIWAGAAFEIGFGYPFWIASALMVFGTFLTWQLTPDPARKRAGRILQPPADEPAV
jgi:MFS family permease